MSWCRETENYFITWARLKAASLYRLLIYSFLMGISTLTETPTFALFAEMFPGRVISTRWELRALGTLEQSCSCIEVDLFGWVNIPSIFKGCDKVAWGNGSTYGSKFLPLLMEKENAAVSIWFYSWCFMGVCGMHSGSCRQGIALDSPWRQQQQHLHSVKSGRVRVTAAAPI